MVQVLVFSSQGFVVVFSLSRSVYGGRLVESITFLTFPICSAENNDA